MKKTIKVIELFNKLNNGEELPKKVKYGIHEYVLNEKRDDYECSKNKIWSLFYLILGKSTATAYFLNDEVEIIEEDEKPKEIKLFELNNDIYVIDDSFNEKVLRSIVCLNHKCDELTKAVNYLLKKEDNHGN